MLYQNIYEPLPHIYNTYIPHCCLHKLLNSDEHQGTFFTFLVVQPKLLLLQCLIFIWVVDWYLNINFNFVFTCAICSIAVSNGCPDHSVCQSEGTHGRDIDHRKFFDYNYYLLIILLFKKKKLNYLEIWSYYNSIRLRR